MQFCPNKLASHSEVLAFLGSHLTRFPSGSFFPNNSYKSLDAMLKEIKSPAGLHAKCTSHGMKMMVGVQISN